jgi:hypothetical protein
MSRFDLGYGDGALSTGASSSGSGAAGAETPTPHTRARLPLAPIAGAFHAFRMATPEQVIEVRESKKVFDEIKAKRTAHIKQCAHRD